MRILPIDANIRLCTENRFDIGRIYVDKFDRIYELHRILVGRKTPISIEHLKEKWNKNIIGLSYSSPTRPLKL